MIGETVYVATWELYEDFNLIGVFSTLEKAIARCKEKNAEHYDPNFYPMMGEFVDAGDGDWHCAVHKTESDIGYFIRSVEVE